jgi:hypothetical protein
MCVTGKPSHASPYWMAAALRRCTSTSPAVIVVARAAFPFCPSPQGSMVPPPLPPNGPCRGCTPICATPIRPAQPCSPCWPFFCVRYVTEAVFALARTALSTLRIGSPPSRKMMSPIRSVFVRGDPLASEYLHEHVAKKKAPTTSCPMARCDSVAFANSSTTAAGRACCCVGSGSARE